MDNHAVRGVGYDQEDQQNPQHMWECLTLCEFVLQENWFSS